MFVCMYVCMYDLNIACLCQSIEITTTNIYQPALSLLAIWCLGPRVQILHSAEEANLSPFDLKYRLPVPEHRN